MISRFLCRYEYFYALLRDFPDLTFTINGGITSVDEVSYGHCDQSVLWTCIFMSPPPLNKRGFFIFGVKFQTAYSVFM